MADNKKPKRQLPKPNLPGGKTPRNNKFTRRPLFWILVSIVVVTIFGEISSSSNQFTKVETSQVMSAITRGDVEAAKIVDRDQNIQIVLKAGKAINGATKVEASYVTGQEPILVDLQIGRAHV